jgi:hypothetical protein
MLLTATQAIRDAPAPYFTYISQLSKTTVPVLSALATCFESSQSVRFITILSAKDAVKVTQYAFAFGNCSLLSSGATWCYGSGDRDRPARRAGLGHRESLLHRTVNLGTWLSPFPPDNYTNALLSGLTLPAVARATRQLRA